MATPAAPASQPSAPQSTDVSAFAVSTGGAAGFMSQRPSVASPRSIPWTFLVSEAALLCRGGTVIPRLARAYWQPGLGMNAPGSPMEHRGSGYIAQMAAEGWRAVGHDVPATAWKVDRRTVARASTYLVEHRVLRVGDRVEVGHWTDAWTRPVAFGGQLRTEFDEQGWLDWCKSLIPMIGRGDGGTLASYQIDHACEPYLAEIKNIMGSPRQSPAAVDRIKLLLHLLPESHRPAAAVALVKG